MSIPPAKPAAPSVSTPPTPKSAPKSATLQHRPGQRNAQRHSAGTIDYDNVEACGGDSASAAAGDDDDPPIVPFRGRSQTIGKQLIQ